MTFSIFFTGFKDVGAAYKNRQFHEKQTLMMAKSLPMNVPMPDNRRLFSNRSPPDIAEETQDIPTKIAELAKSLHMDAIGELPSPRLLEQWRLLELSSLVRKILNSCFPASLCSNCHYICQDLFEFGRFEEF